MAVETEYVIHCRRCNARAVAKSKANSEWIDDEFNEQIYIIVQCQICFDLAFIRHSNDEHFPRTRAVVLWPNADRMLSKVIPESLRLEHGESRSCFRNGAYTAAVVMVRRTIEGVCAENGVRERTLVKSLEKMKESQLIDNRLLEWAQELRVLGNEGAHFTGNRVSRVDAEDALALAEAILDYLYVFNAQFKAFKERRKEREEALAQAVPAQGEGKLPGRDGGS